MKAIKIIFLSAILGLLSLSCSRKNTEAELGAEEEFKLATEKFENKDYGKAKDGFKRIVFRYPGSKWSEDAQFKLARCYFLEKDYTTAKIEYDFFVNSYPRSRFTDDAAFESAVCSFNESGPYYLDPSLIKKSLQEFQGFIKKYPDSERIKEAIEYAQKCIDKLAQKDMETAKLYIRVGKFTSAILYLKGLQEDYPNTSFSSEITSLLHEAESRCEKQK